MDLYGPVYAGQFGALNRALNGLENDPFQALKTTLKTGLFLLLFICCFFLAWIDRRSEESVTVSSSSLLVLIPLDQLRHPTTTPFDSGD